MSCLFLTTLISSAGSQQPTSELGIDNWQIQLCAMYEHLIGIVRTNLNLFPIMSVSVQMGLFSYKQRHRMQQQAAKSYICVSWPNAQSASRRSFASGVFCQSGMQ